MAKRNNSFEIFIREVIRNKQMIKMKTNDILIIFCDVMNMWKNSNPSNHWDTFGSIRTEFESHWPHILLLPSLPSKNFHCTTSWSSITHLERTLSLILLIPYFTSNDDRFIHSCQQTGNENRKQKYCLLASDFLIY